jgi:peptidoglycan/LPS O-acetylase OafA/YrhL
MNVANDDMLYLPGFLLGIAAAAAVIRPGKLQRYTAVAIIPLCVGALAIDARLGAEGGFNPLWMALAFCVVVTCAQWSPARTLLSSRVLVGVGIASYSIYLVHQPIIEVLQRHGLSPEIAIAGAIVVGFGFWACAERPFVFTAARRISNGFAQRLLQRFVDRVGIRGTSFWLYQQPLLTEYVADVEAKA